MRLVTSIQLNSTKDATHHLLLVGIWWYVAPSQWMQYGHQLVSSVNWYNSEVEITSGLICFCLPVFPRLYRQQIKKIFSASSASHTYLHHSVFPTHNPYKRHLDGPQGVQELKPFQSGQLSLSKTHPINLMSRESPELWKQNNHPGNIGLKILSQPTQNP